MKRMILALAYVACACGAARPVRAQAPADTAALARATATLLADSVLARSDDVMIWQFTDDTFNSAVAENLRDTPQIGRPAADPTHAVHIGIEAMTMDADSARVRVKTWQQYADSGSLDTWIERHIYVFQHTDGGWRYLRTVFLGHADAGPVRGRR
ncbi:hypothetical protein [Longimicrobium sp.]|uniref:hypothetical protein n=1 Tax=Longimicrobium sp. TaxID=2029185 RepID=UPI002D7FE3F9|nr:hypothetical protein [Longimicrobium sp.]